MENETKIGMNRTGMQMSPFKGPDQAEFAQTHPADPPDGGMEAIAAERADYIRQSPRIGSVPVPGTGKGLLKVTMNKMMGKNPEVLIDRLGGRLAFERSGVRLYQAMITKVEAVGHTDQDKLLADLKHICNEETEHFRMLSDVLQNMGADPTAQTPCADVGGVASLGLMQVITDPRTTVAQSLDAMLTAELTDNAGWELLIELADQAGQETLVTSFRDALAAEKEHLAIVQRWLTEDVLSEAT